MAQEDDLKKARDLLRVGASVFKEAGIPVPLAELGIADATAPSISTRHRREDEASTLWDRMTPAERTELARSNPEEFKRVTDAKGEAGMRALMNGPGNQPR